MKSYQHLDGYSLKLKREEKRNKHAWHCDVLGPAMLKVHKDREKIMTVF